MKINQLKAGAFLSYISIIFTTVIGMVLTPYMIKYLGTAEFGLYNLIGAFVGYLTLLDFGLNNTIIRFIAKYRAKKDKKGEEEFLSTSFIIYGFISLTIIIIGVVLYQNINHIFSKTLSVEELRKAKIMFIILIFNLAITLPGNAFKGISSGYEKFIFPKTTNIIKYLMRSIFLIVLLLIGGDSVDVVILDTIMNILLISVNAYYVFKILKVRLKFYGFKNNLFKKIFKYSFWIFIFVIVNQFQWRVGQMVLGIKLNTKIVAIYAIGVMLGTYYGTFSSAITSLFLPRATKMTVENASKKDLTDMMIRIGRISLIILLYVLGAFIIYGKQFINLWVGNEYLESWRIAVIIMIFYTIPLVQAFAHSILEAKNLLSFRAVIYFISLLLGTILGITLVNKHGATGMIIGTVSGWFVAQNIMNIYYHKIINLNISRFFLELSERITFSLLLITPLALLIDLIPGTNWMNFIIKSFLYTCIYIVIMYYFGMKKFEKNLIKNIFTSISAKLPFLNKKFIRL